MIQWKEDTRRGSFDAFFAAYGSLSRQEFLERFTAPVLMTAVSTDSGTWSATLVLKVEKPKSAAKIAITDDGGSTGDLAAAAGRIYVGRTADADVVIPAPTVSKKHAFFTKRDFAWEITDNGSSNGTILEGQPLKPNRRERIRRSLATIDFGPDARFVFMLPESVFDLIEEIRRSRGLRAEAAVKATNPVPDRAADPSDFESLPAPSVEEEANTSAVRSVHPAKPASVAKEEPAEAAPEPAPAATGPEPPRSTPRHRSTWQGKRPDSLVGDTESLGKSTDKIPVKVGKTPQEIEDINFDYALRAVTSLGPLIHKLEAIHKLGDQVTVLLGEGSKNSIEECREALVKLRPLLRSIRMEMTVGDRKPVEIFRIES